MQSGAIRGLKKEINFRKRRFLPVRKKNFGM
jgi:hypothetical protein